MRPTWRARQRSGDTRGGAPSHDRRPRRHGSRKSRWHPSWQATIESEGRIFRIEHALSTLILNQCCSNNPQKSFFDSIHKPTGCCATSCEGRTPPCRLRISGTLPQEQPGTPDRGRISERTAKAPRYLCGAATACRSRAVEHERQPCAGHPWCRDLDNPRRYGRRADDRHCQSPHHCRGPSAIAADN
jgi:hypothetical protein